MTAKPDVHAVSDLLICPAQMHRKQLPQPMAMRWVAVSCASTKPRNAHHVRHALAAAAVAVAVVVAAATVAAATVVVAAATVAAATAVVETVVVMAVAAAVVTATVVAEVVVKSDLP